MASHGALQLTSPKLLLLVLTLLIAIRECKTLHSYSPTNPNQHSLRLGSTIPPPEKEQKEVEIGREEEAAEEGERGVGRQLEFLDVREFQRAVNEERSSMAAATRPTIKSWPNLVGLDAEEAKKKILEEHPTMVVHIVPEGSLMTMDFNLRRVRIHKNKEEKVAQIPRQG